jgi:hypothetical protein
MLKLSILTELANDKNFQEVLSELGEYVSDVDTEIAKKSIQVRLFGCFCACSFHPKCVFLASIFQGIGKIAVRVQAAVDDAIDHLLSFLNLSMDYVTTETAVVVKDLLRKYPERYEEIIPSMQKCLKTIEDSEGKVAVIWMIGEYGDTISDAPYILEHIIDTFEEEPANAVRLELLTAAMKLFFKRPPEMHKMVCILVLGSASTCLSYACGFISFLASFFFSLFSLVDYYPRLLLIKRSTCEIALCCITVFSSMMSTKLLVLSTVPKTLLNPSLKLKITN